MTEVPKIVRHRLQQAASIPQDPDAAAHPDANLLAAFAEQALSASERDTVIEHLARCGDCREVLALALPASEVVAASITAGAEVALAPISRAAAAAPRRLGIAWPTLRWAALAAGIAVAGSVLLLHPWKRNAATPTSAARQIAGNAPPSFASPASSPAGPPVELPTTLARADAAKLKPPPPRPHGSRSMEATHPSSAGEPLPSVSGSKKSDPTEKQPPAGGAEGRALDLPAGGATTEIAEVSAADATVAGVRPNQPLAPRNETPAIARAKAVPPGIEAKTLAKAPAAAVVSGAAAQTELDFRYAANGASLAGKTSAHAILWAVTAGVLQRSIDGGQTWQSAFHADQPLLCHASHGTDVWVGGQAGILFHSSDDGATWSPVRPSVQGQTLDSDIVHINLRSLTEINVFTADRKVWITADGGKTWSLQNQP